MSGYNSYVKNYMHLILWSNRWGLVFTPTGVRKSTLVWDVKRAVIRLKTFKNSSKNGSYCHYTLGVSWFSFAFNSKGYASLKA